MSNNGISINSISELRDLFSKLKSSQLRIEEILGKLSQVYASMPEGYSSANSTKIQNSMEECTHKGKVIADNISLVEQKMNDCISEIESVDEITTE